MVFFLHNFPFRRPSEQQHCGRRWHGRVIMLELFPRLFFSLLHRSCNGSMEDFPSAESEEIARKPTKSVCKSQWQFHECFMNHPGLARGGGLHKALLRACFRCHFGYKRDFHEDITPRGIHTRCIKATNLFSFAMENSAAPLRKAAPHMPRSMIIMIACGMKRMKSVLKFIVAINPSSQKFHLWRAIFLLSHASLAPNSGFIAIVKTQRCLIHNFWAHNLVNVHRTCSPLLTRLQRTVNEPQPKMIKINYCWAWFVVDGNQCRFLDKPFSCFPQYSVEAKPKIYIFNAWAAKSSSSCDVTSRHAPFSIVASKIAVCWRRFGLISSCATGNTIFHYVWTTFQRLETAVVNKWGEKANERPDTTARCNFIGVFF